MGFSSFGAKPNPKKKRKLDQSSAGSGSNSLPLGTGRRQEIELASKTDIGSEEKLVGEGNKTENFGRQEAEKDEDGDGETTGEDGGVPIPHSFGNAYPPRAYNTEPSLHLRESLTENSNDANNTPDLQRTSRNPPFQAPNSLPPRPPPSTSSSFQNMQSQSQPQWLAQTQPSPYTQKSQQAYDLRALRKGIRDENGDMAYYDESFVEDPWRALRI